jgi:hypothetical protein
VSADQRVPGNPSHLDAVVVAVLVVGALTMLVVAVIDVVLMLNGG